MGAKELDTGVEEALRDLGTGVECPADWDLCFVRRKEGMENTYLIVRSTGLECFGDRKSVV